MPNIKIKCDLCKSDSTLWINGVSYCSAHAQEADSGFRRYCQQKNKLKN